MRDLAELLKMAALAAVVPLIVSPWVSPARLALIAVASFYLLLVKST